MTREQIDAMLHALLEWVDYDTAKNYRHDTSEEPDFVDEAMQELRDIVHLHMEKSEK